MYRDENTGTTEPWVVGMGLMPTAGIPASPPEAKPAKGRAESEDGSTKKPHFDDDLMQALSLADISG